MEKLKIKSVCCNKDIAPDGQKKTIVCSNCKADLGQDPYNEEKMIITKMFEY